MRVGHLTLYRPEPLVSYAGILPTRMSCLQQMPCCPGHRCARECASAILLSVAHPGPVAGLSTQLTRCPHAMCRSQLHTPHDTRHHAHRSPRQRHPCSAHRYSAHAHAHTQPWQRCIARCWCAQCCSSLPRQAPLRRRRAAPRACLAPRTAAASRALHSASTEPHACHPAAALIAPVPQDMVGASARTSSAAWTMFWMATSTRACASGVVACRT